MLLWNRVSCPSSHGLGPLGPVPAGGVLSNLRSQWRVAVMSRVWVASVCGLEQQPGGCGRGGGASDTALCFLSCRGQGLHGDAAEDVCRAGLQPGRREGLAAWRQAAHSQQDFQRCGVVCCSPCPWSWVPGQASKPLSPFCASLASQRPRPLQGHVFETWFCFSTLFSFAQTSP